MAKKVEEKSNLSLAEKKKRIRAQIDKINAAAGQVVTGFLSDSEMSDVISNKFIPTPNDDLNEAIGGGWPIGKTTIVSGLSDSGKTSILLETIGQQMNKQGNEDWCALWLESENSLDLEYMIQTFKIDPERFVIIKTSLKEGGEAALDQAESYLRTGAFSMFVINSMKALIPKTQLNKTISEDGVCLQARMNGKALAKYVPLIAQYDICFVIVQHLTTLIGSMSRDYLLGAV